MIDVSDPSDVNGNPLNDEKCMHTKSLNEIVYESNSFRFTVFNDLICIIKK